MKKCTCNKAYPLRVAYGCDCGGRKAAGNQNVQDSDRSGVVKAVQGTVEFGWLIIVGWIGVAVLAALYLGYQWFVSTAWPWLVATQWVQVVAIVALLSPYIIGELRRARTRRKTQIVRKVDREHEVL